MRTLIKSGRSWRKISHKAGAWKTPIEHYTGGVDEMGSLAGQPNLPFYKLHNRLHNASTSSFVVAQLVAKRITVWVSSYFSQKPNSTCFSRRVIRASSTIQNTWLVGEPKQRLKFCSLKSFVSGQQPGSPVRLLFIERVCK